MVYQYMEPKRALTDISKEELFSLTNKDRQSVFFSKTYSFLGFSLYINGTLRDSTNQVYGDSWTYNDSDLFVGARSDSTFKIVKLEIKLD